MGDMKNRRGGQRIFKKTSEKTAITQFFSSAAKPRHTRLYRKASLRKTHQIRVALKSIGAPILGIHFMGVRHQTGCIFMHGICAYLCLLVNYRLLRLSIQVKS